MTKKLFLAILTWSMAAQMTATAAVRDTISLNRGWLFHHGEEAEAWTTVDLPHDFQIGQPWTDPSQQQAAGADLGARGFKPLGIGWYKKTIIPDNAWRDRRVMLDFQGIMLVGDVYLNGERIGGTEYGYLGFDIDISDKLVYGQENELTVRADTRNPENSRWYTGGGLFRDVNIIVTPKEYYLVRHPLQILTALDGTVKVSAELYWHDRAKTDSFSIGLRILNKEGRVVAGHTSRLKHQRRQRVRAYQLDSIVIPDVRLWDCDDPYLYTAVVALLDQQGNTADEVSEQFGVRTIAYSPEFGFKLNGKKTLLKGIADHSTLGMLGCAAYPRAIEKRLQMLKSFGYNNVRTAHNPPSEEFMRLCDRNGIIVVEELYDKWLTEFAGGRTAWTDIWQHDVVEFVRRDRNHPSVVMWSLGNELQTYSTLPYNDWGVTPYRLMRTLLRRYDTTRPTTVAMHPRGRNLETDSLPAPLALETDIASYNYRYMYFPGDSRRFPDMVFYQSESNTVGIPANFFAMNRDKVIGLAHWGAIDYIGESQGWPDKGWKEGLFDISMNPKPIAYHVKSYYSDEPLVHIAVEEPETAEKAKDETADTGTDDNINSKRMSENWNREAGDSLTIHVYSNADETELLLNGKSLGRQRNPDKDDERNRMTWRNVAWQAGRLEAVGRKGGKVVARHAIETTGPAVALRLEGDNPEWKADGQDLLHVSITAVDKKGRRVANASLPVTVGLKGAARQVAICNGDIASDALPQDTVISLHEGTALVILRAGWEEGDVSLSVSAPRLKGAVLKRRTLTSRR